MSDMALVSDGVPKKCRSAVSNGRRLFVEGTGNTAWARRHRDIVDALVAEFDATNESDLLLVRRAANLSLQLEQQELAAVRGESVDTGAMVTAGNALRRLLRDLRASWKARKRAARGVRI